MERLTSEQIERMIFIVSRMLPIRDLVMINSNEEIVEGIPPKFETIEELLAEKGLTKKDLHDWWISQGIRGS